jgi:chromosomal replication initiation ATPase DnaA
MSQFAFSIVLPTTYARELFVCSASNQLAFDTLDSWPNWSIHALYLSGERGAGKTHLAHIWQQKTQAVLVEPNSDMLPDGAMIIDGIERWNNEQQLFHVINHAILQKHPLLVTAIASPDDISIALPDIRSRLKAMLNVAITAPDDALISAVLCKQLADRQLKISPDSLNYIMPRLPRSFVGISEMVNVLDTASLQSHRVLSIPFIRQTLGW